MDTVKFRQLVESTIDRANLKTDPGKCLSRPSGKLVELYGPMTNKLLKAKSVLKAQELYDTYIKEGPTKSDRFIAQVEILEAIVTRLPSEATNASTTTMGALVWQCTGFRRAMDAAIKSVPQPSAGVSGVLLAAADMMITTGLAFIPIAGPFLAPLSMGLGGAIGYGINAGLTAGINQGLGEQLVLLNTGSAQQKADQKTAINNDPNLQNIADAGTAAGKNISGFVSAQMGTLDKKSALGQLAAQKGLASLVATGFQLMCDKCYESALKEADIAGAFNTMITTQTQNQAVGSEINTLKALKVELPVTLRNTQDRANFFLKEDKTLKMFESHTQKVFTDFFSLVNKVINSGVIGSFKQSTDQLRIDDVRYSDESFKIALLMLGYFYSKSWDAPTKLQRGQMLPGAEQQKLDIEKRLQENRDQAQTLLNLPERNVDSEQLRGEVLKKITTDEGELQRNAALLTMLTKKGTTIPSLSALVTGPSGTPAAQNVVANFKNATARDKFRTTAFTTTGADQDLEKLPRIMQSATDYFKALKEAIVCDIESAFLKGNSGFLSDEDMTEMWTLYIACQLIINEVLADTKLRENSKMRKFTAAFSKGAVSIDDRYIAMLEKLGFIKRYSSKRTFGIVSDAKKKELAKDRQLRWASSPSDGERAMLVTFCTVVAFFMDVGKISLGFQSWEETKEKLHVLCQEITSTRYAP